MGEVIATTSLVMKKCDIEVQFNAVVNILPALVSGAWLTM